MTDDDGPADLPTFSRRIGVLTARSETGSLGVLEPFSGVLNPSAESERRPGAQSIPSLSYLTLQSLVQRELVERESANAGQEPSNRREPPEQSTERRVYEVLRDADESDSSGRSPDSDARTASTEADRQSTALGDASEGSPSPDAGFDRDDSPGGRDEIGLDEFTDELDESVFDNDKNMLRDSKNMSEKDESTSNPDWSEQFDDRGRRDSTDSDSSLAESESSPTDADPSESARGDSDRPRGTDAGRGLDTGDATGRLSRLATLDTPTARRQSATETPTTASRIEVPPTLSPVETPSLPSDEGGIDFGSPLTYSTHGRADSSPTGAFQMTYQRPASVASSSTDRLTEFEDAISQSAAESADSGSEQTDAERGGRNGTGLPRSAEIDLDEIDVSRLVDRVYDEFQRKTRIERERRGL